MVTCGYSEHGLSMRSPGPVEGSHLIDQHVSSLGKGSLFGKVCRCRSWLVTSTPFEEWSVKPGGPRIINK